MKHLNGKITIGRWTGGGGNHGVRITIEDVNSQTNICEINMSTEDFAKAMFGCSYQDCQIELYENYKTAGKFPIRKTVWIEFNSVSFSRENYHQEINKFVKNTIGEYEVDGWQYSSHQVSNGHYAKREDGSTKYPVYLVKYVDTLKEQEDYENANRIEQSKHEIPTKRSKRSSNF